MKVLPLAALVGLAAIAGTGGTAAEPRAPAPLEIADLRFATLPRNPGAIEVAGDRDRALVTVERARLSAARGIAPGDPDGPAGFVLDAAAGRVGCEGERRRGRAQGSCRFVSSPAFEVGLAQRGVALEQRRDLLGLALVDARLALVDDLAREGVPVRTSGQLIAAAALEVTGRWAHELKDAGLAIDEVDDLIAVRALDIEPGYVRAMAEAGYPHLTASQAIAMKAVGVTPAYAVAMNTAARAVAAAGELQ